MDVDDAHMIGARLRRIRQARRMSLRVVAGLAGMSKSRLSAIERGEAVLDSVTVPTSSPQAAQLAGMLALSGSLVAAAGKRPGDTAAALEHAAEIARHTGGGNAFWMGFGPVNVGLWQMAGALELGDHEQAVATAEGLHPQVRDRSRQVWYWLGYGRALARVRGRYDDAVLAFHRAEAISPVHLHRNPLAHDALATLVERSRQDAIGRELRGMTYRAGLPV